MDLEGPDPRLTLRVPSGILRDPNPGRPSCLSPSMSERVPQVPPAQEGETAHFPTQYLVLEADSVLSLKRESKNGGDVSTRSVVPLSRRVDPDLGWGCRVVRPVFEVRPV